MRMLTRVQTLFNRMTQDSDAFIEADGSRLITTCYHWVAEKPRDDSSPAKTGSPASSETGVKADSGASSDVDETPTPASSNQSISGDAGNTKPTAKTGLSPLPQNGAAAAAVEVTA